jgi:hypothetical protein
MDGSFYDLNFFVQRRYRPTSVFFPKEATQTGKVFADTFGT